MREFYSIIREAKEKVQGQSPYQERVELEANAVLKFMMNSSEQVNGPLFNFSLHQNYPNPFNRDTRVEYELSESANVTVKIFNILGQEIKTLIKREQEPGDFQVIWNGTNNNNVPVSSGIYLYRIRAGNYVKSKKMTLLK